MATSEAFVVMDNSAVGIRCTKRIVLARLFLQLVNAISSSCVHVSEVFPFFCLLSASFKTAWSCATPGIKRL